MNEVVPPKRDTALVQIDRPWEPHHSKYKVNDRRIPSSTGTPPPNLTYYKFCLPFPVGNLIHSLQPLRNTTKPKL